MKISQSKLTKCSNYKNPHKIIFKDSTFLATSGIDETQKTAKIQIHQTSATTPQQKSILVPHFNTNIIFHYTELYSSTELKNINPILLNFWYVWCFAFRLTGGSVETGVFLIKRQQVDFTFLPQQGILQASGELSPPTILICDQREFWNSKYYPVSAISLTIIAGKVMLLYDNFKLKFWILNWFIFVICATTHLSIKAVHIFIRVCLFGGFLLL